MTFDEPIAFEAALRELREKRLLPTHLSSDELRDLGRQAREAAVFSARMTEVRAVQALKDGAGAMAAGRENLADAKLRLLRTLGDLGYTPEGGFPGDEEMGIPPARRGSLRDLASTRRREPQLKTQYRMAGNLGRIKSETSEGRQQFPCWELVRVEGRREPRGTWPARFRAAGGTLYGGRMIARKDSPVWPALGNGAGGYDDTLGNPYPPFAFGSGMGVRDVPRTECVELGVIAPEDEVSDMDPDLRQSLRADAGNLDTDLLDAFDADLEIREGEVRLRQSAAA